MTGQTGNGPETHTDRNMELGGNVNVFNNSSADCYLSIMKHGHCENMCVHQLQD